MIIKGLSEADRQAIAGILVKVGYTVSIIKILENKRYIRVLEFTEQGE